MKTGSSDLQTRGQKAPEDRLGTRHSNKHAPAMWLSDSAFREWGGIQVSAQEPWGASYRGYCFVQISAAWKIDLRSVIFDERCHWDTYWSKTLAISQGFIPLNSLVKPHQHGL